MGQPKKYYLKNFSKSRVALVTMGLQGLACFMLTTPPEGNLVAICLQD